MAKITVESLARLRVKRDESKTKLSRSCAAAAGRYRACADKLELAAKEFNAGGMETGYEYLKGAEKALDPPS